MSPPSPSPINPSLAVERIREIIVGRHLERIEQRVAQLESCAPPAGPPASQWEDRLCTAEARLEALQESVQRLNETVRDEAGLRHELQREEIQRMANQIQQIAATKAAEAALPPIQQLESRLGAWLGNWQTALQRHLDERENRLATQLRSEVANLWEHTESQITHLQSRTLDRAQIEDRFSRIASAARALADCAAAAAGSASPTP